YFGRFPTNDEAGAGEHILPNLPNCFLCCCRRRVWRQYRGVIGIVGDSLVQVLASRSFRPGGISVAKCLPGLAVPGQTDSCSGQTESKSGYQQFRFHMGIKDPSLIWGQCFLTADNTDSTLGIHPGGLRAMGLDFVRRNSRFSTDYRSALIA